MDDECASATHRTGPGPAACHHRRGRAIANEIERFIARWAAAEQAERTNAQPFLSELCDIIGVPCPAPAQGGAGDYRFERSVTHRAEDGRETTCRIDLYCRDRFILEAKQGASPAPARAPLAPQPETARRQAVRHSPGWSQHMLRAKGQAKGAPPISRRMVIAPKMPFIAVRSFGATLPV
jgi:hypothetical protein